MLHAFPARFVFSGTLFVLNPYDLAAANTRPINARPLKKQ